MLERHVASGPVHQLLLDLQLATDNLLHNEYLVVLSALVHVYLLKLLLPRDLQPARSDLLARKYNCRQKHHLLKLQKMRHLSCDL